MMNEMETKLTEKILENRCGKPENPGWQPQVMSWLLEKSGMQIKDLEKATGIKESTLSAYKDGRCSPNMGAAVKIADFFQVPLDFLVGRCSENETGEIFEHFEDYFLNLRYAAYDAYLLNKYDGDNALRSKTVFTWPFNLIESIYQLDNNECIEFDYNGLEEAISTLTEREIELIRLRYREEMTLREVAESIQISTECVRQAINKACRKLRHPARLRLIRYGNLGIEMMTKLDERERAVAAKERELAAREKRIEEQERAFGIERERQEALKIDRMGEKLEEMELSIRPYNCLKRKGCNTVGDVCKLVEEGDLLMVRNLGVKCAREVLLVLKRDYGMDYTGKYTLPG